jgi:hypothetical protein
MDNITNTVIQKNSLGSFAYACNKFQYDWIEEHASSLNRHNKLLDDMDPKVRSTVKRQMKKQDKDKDIDSFYEGVTRARELREKEWDQDVERDEGKIFSYLKKQDEDNPNLLFNISIV